MTSKRQRFWTGFARIMQKPALALITPPVLARPTFILNAITTYKTPPGLVVTPMELGGVRAAECRIGSDPTPNGTLLYIHGGAFMIGHLRGYRHLVALLAKGAGQRGIFIDYRLAPEHPFPAALDDAEAAYRALLEQNAGPITLVGDSAGGNIALALLLRLKSAGLPLPTACACFSPATDLRGLNDSLTSNRRKDPLVPVSWARRGAAAYVAGNDPAHPEISPVLGDFAGAPPILIHVDDDEVLRDDSLHMADTLRRAQVDVTLHRHQGLFHVWHLMAGRSPEADAAVAEAAAFLRNHLLRN